MAIPMLDLKTQYNALKDDINENIQRVMDSCMFMLGPEVTALEEEVVEYLGTGHAIGCASGTDALVMALMALDIKPGDEIITTPFTFFATTEAASLLGIKPVFVDIDPETYNIDINKIEAAITPRTKAVIPVHLYGQTCLMSEILAIAEKHNIKVIEDTAQAMGAEQDGKKAGTFGDMGTLSFFPAKNLGCFGDGGMIVTDNADIAKELRLIRNHGDESRYHHVRVGINGRIDAIQAAVLRVKLPFLDRWIDQRIRIVDIYNKLLADTGISLPKCLENNKHAYNQYTIRLENRDGLQKYLADKDIASAVHYPIPLHLQKVYNDLGYKKGDLPESEKAAEEVLSLPLYPELPEKDAEYICENIRNFIENK